ncbi:MAG: Sensor histidine kinase RcsC [Syntrophus sp. SKADARSKE-3]|nr:Sensor histidine kinase RcsC [Syntrophus sp. SKADARSKE-3]
MSDQDTLQIEAIPTWTQSHFEPPLIDVSLSPEADIQEILLTSLLNAVPHAVLGFRDNKIIFANGAVEAVFGWKPGTLIGKTSGFLYDSDLAFDAIGQDINTPIDIHKPHQAIYRHKHRDGRKVICRVSISRTGNDERQKMMVAVFEDITEQYKKENKLRELNENLDDLVQKRTKELSALNDRLQEEIRIRTLSEDRLKRSEQEKSVILDAMSDHVLLLDKDMKILWSNTSLQEYFHASPKTLNGNYCYAALYNRTIPCSSCPSFEAITSGLPQDFERIDSSDRTWIFRGFPVFDNDGAPIGAVEIVSDITERKQSEEALRQSEERYRNIIETMEDGYFETDLEGNITFANEAMLRIFGYARDEFMGVNHRHYSTPAEAKRIFDAFHELYLTDVPIKIFDHEIVRKDGQIRHVEVSTSLLKDALGRPIGFRGINRDVTDRIRMSEEKKKLTKQLNQAQKMEAIGTLAGGIAHDFNNLLMGIQGYTSLMLLSLDPTHAHHEKLKAIEQQVQSGADLTKQLLGFARGGRYEVTPTDINALISKTAAMFGRTKKEIRIHEKYAKDLWIVETDRGQMEQVMLNLFVNAWQAMPGGGSLYLETQNVYLDDAYLKPYDVISGPYTKISVTDTGFGMDEKTLQRIFDPFFTTKEMGRGTGLGLASAYGIIKGHSGFINVYSEKGHGTTFNLYLPASKKELIQPEELSTDILTGGETILIVDDEPIITDVTSALLEGLGYKVFIAQSGEEAVDIYSKYHDQIDLVIMDMIMPGIGGGKAFDRIQAINPKAKVILSSGYSLNGMAKDILTRGVKAFLQKPFRVTDLSHKIREVLKQR